MLKLIQAEICASFGDLILDIEGSSALPPAQERKSFLGMLGMNFGIKSSFKI